MQVIDRFPRKSIPARGVTLIELMIVVAIIGIIAAITLPAYSKYLVNAHRSAAQSHMMDMASRQGEIFADSRSYAAKAELIAILPTPPAVSKQYTIDITTTAVPPTYKITATPTTTGKQAGDGNITLDYAGVKEPAAKW